jgi:hypothetical protein
MLCVILLAKPTEVRAVMAMPLPHYVVERSHQCLLVLSKLAYQKKYNKLFAIEVLMLSERFFGSGVLNFNERETIQGQSQTKLTYRETSLELKDCRQDLIDFTYELSKPDQVTFSCGVSFPDLTHSWSDDDFSYYENLVAKILDSQDGYEISGRPVPSFLEAFEAIKDD